MKEFYKIDGNIFGNQHLREDGTMDERQFVSGDLIDYSTGLNGPYSLEIAKQYGAKPVSVITTEFGRIDVYKVVRDFVGFCDYGDGWYSSTPQTLRNTVNPAAIVRYFRNWGEESALTREAIDRQNG